MPSRPSAAQAGATETGQPARAARAAGPQAGRPASAARPAAGQAGQQAGAAPAAPPPKADPAAVGGFIERFAGILYSAGMPRMPARVFAALLAADASQLSAAELAAVLGVSPAAVSGAVRYLTQISMVAAAGEPGSRRLSYSVPDDVWIQLMDTRNTLLARLSTTLRDGVALLGSGTPGGDRLTRSAQYFDFVLAEIAEVDNRWRGLGTQGDPIPSPQGDTGPDGTGPDGARADGPA